MLLLDKKTQNNVWTEEKTPIILSLIYSKNPLIKSTFNIVGTALTRNSIKNIFFYKKTSKINLAENE